MLKFCLTSSDSQENLIYVLPGFNFFPNNSSKLKVLIFPTKMHYSYGVALVPFQTIKPHVEAEEKQTESRTVTPPAAPKPKREENPQVSEQKSVFFF